MVLHQCRDSPETSLIACLLLSHHLGLRRDMEMPCPTCPTWFHFIQGKLKISIYMCISFLWSIITGSHCGSWSAGLIGIHTVYKRVDIWFHTFFEKVNCLSTVRYKLFCSFRQVKKFIGQVHYGHLHVTGQIENSLFPHPCYAFPDLVSIQ